MGSRFEPGSELILKEGVTTSNGAGGATTLIDSSLIGENDFLTNTSVIIISGIAQYEVRDVTGFNTANGTITVSPAFSAQIVSGVGYRIVAISSAKAEVDAIQADVGDASLSTLGSLYGILGNPAAGQDLATRIGYEGATSLASKLTAARAALIDQITALRMAELDAANLPADIDTIKGYTDSLEGAVGAIEGATTLHNKLTAARAGYLDALAATALGKVQIATAAIDLNQAAATYDLFTGTTQNVMVETLVIRMPDLAAGGALTSISIQTDDSTPQVFISAALGAVANLTAQAQLASDSPVVVATGKKIRLTIAGGATGVAYSCTVTASYKAIVAGGYLA